MNNRWRQENISESEYSLYKHREAFWKYYWRTFRRWSQWLGILTIGLSYGLIFWLIAKLTEMLEPFYLRVILITVVASIFAGIGAFIYAKIVLFDIRQMILKDKNR